MIKIVTKSNNGIINKVYISGHAGYDMAGKDIVCASVSSIAITTINAIITLDSEAIYYEESSGKLMMEILNDNQNAYKLIDNMLRMLDELKADYPKNIVIRNEE